ALQSIAGSHHRPRSYSGDRHGILSLPSNGRKAEERSQSELTKTELWKCRSVESLENQKQVFHPSHRPWKSLRDSHIPTAAASHGKVESQHQASHFPTALLFSFSKPNQKACLSVELRPAFRLIH